jgi:hypothetical protein
MLYVQLLPDRFILTGIFCRLNYLSRRFYSGAFFFYKYPVANQAANWSVHLRLSERIPKSVKRLRREISSLD